MTNSTAEILAEMKSFVEDHRYDTGPTARIKMRQLIAALDKSIETIKEGRHQAVITSNQNFKHLAEDTLEEISKILGGS